MATRGDHDLVAGEGGYSFHSVRPDAFNYVWDNSIEPVLEVDSGETVEFTVRDASDEQIRADSTSEDVAKLDFDHVNPVSGPVYVRGAQPGDVLTVEILEFKPSPWVWTAPGTTIAATRLVPPVLSSTSHVRYSKTIGRSRWLLTICLVSEGGSPARPSTFTTRPSFATPKTIYP
jgi:hypothetical protein